MESDLIQQRLDQLQLGDEYILEPVDSLLNTAREFMERAISRRDRSIDLLLGDEDRDLEAMQEQEAMQRDLHIADLMLKEASTHRRQHREIINARNALQAVFSDEMPIIEHYSRNCLGLPALFGEDLRVRGERWPYRDAVAEVLYRRAWARGNQATWPVKDSVRFLAWHLLMDRKKADEQEHIDADEYNLLVCTLDDRGFGEIEPQAGPGSIPSIDLHLDVEQTLAAIEADERFRRIIWRILSGDTWHEDDPDAKHFSTNFRRHYRNLLLRFRALMEAGYITPDVRTFEEQLAAKSVNTPSGLVHLETRALKTN